MKRSISIISKSCDFIAFCETNANNLTATMINALIAVLAMVDGGVAKIHEILMVRPDYAKDDIAKKINAIISAKAESITCRDILNAGYNCPKYRSGCCKCKTPVELCSAPASVDCLRKIIATIPISGDRLTDIDMATKFIKKYMYDQEAIIAKTVINYEIKNKFSLKSCELQPLISCYRDCAKEYKKNQKAQHTTGGSDQEWYIDTDKGLKFLPGSLAKHLAATEKVIYAGEQYYQYRDGVYSPISDAEAQKIVLSMMIDKEAKMSQINDAESQWRLRVETQTSELNHNKYLINVKNGLYDVINNKLLPHDADYYSTIQFAVNYDTSADCLLFKKFLLDSMDDDEGQVTLIQEMMGYLLIPVQIAQKCFVMVGAAGAGKSVLLRTITDIILGSKNVSNISWQELSERFKGAELYGKLANIFADLPSKSIDDNGVFKSLVGEDRITVEKKNKNPFSFQNEARLVFSCNELPRNYGDKSEGFYRRLIIIRFDNPVAPEKRDPDLVDKLRAEADGIFMFALSGLKRLIANNFKFSATDKNAAELQQYREDNDSVTAFVKEFCVITGDPADTIGSSSVYNAYRSYCGDCGLKPYALKRVIHTLVNLPSVTRGADPTGTYRVLKGIKCLYTYDSADYL